MLSICGKSRKRRSVRPLQGRHEVCPYVILLCFPDYFGSVSQNMIVLTECFCASVSGLSVLSARSCSSTRVMQAGLAKLFVLTGNLEDLIKLFKNYAIEHEYDIEDVIENILLDNEKDHDHKDYTLMHYAVLADNIEVMKWLKEQGADINAKDDEGNTPLDLAKARSLDKPVRNQIIDWLKENGAVTGKE